MKELYESEIGSGVYVDCWDGGFEVFLGDEVNGREAQATFTLDQLDTEAAKWLHGMALIRYPFSAYAHKHRNVQG
jgi:hypothetical protein